jgi:hypothetical protein
MIKDKNKTAFSRIKRQGFPAPRLNIYDQARKLVQDHYHINLEKILKLIRQNAKTYNVSIKKGEMVKDSVFDLIQQIKYLLFEGGKELYPSLKNKLRFLMNKSQSNFFKDFYQDADEGMAKFLIVKSLNKNDVFHDKLKEIRELFLDNAINRISGEQDNLKKSFLTKLTDWTEGKAETLDLENLLQDMKSTAISSSKFFARDQFLKLNKASMIASYREAGVKRVQVVCVDDMAVRGRRIGKGFPVLPDEHNHWKHNKEIYSINNIPLFIWDYNCRCFLKPLWEV